VKNVRNSIKCVMRFNWIECIFASGKSKQIVAPNPMWF